MEKGFSERKGQQSKLAFTIHRTLFPAGTTYCVYICGAEWKTWCYFERAEKSLSVMSGSKETLWMLIRWCVSYQDFVCVYFPPALGNQAVTPLEEDDDGDEEDARTVQPHTGSTTAKSNTSQNVKSSLRYYVITSSPADMPGQWHEPGLDREPQHQYCPVLFIYASLLLLFLHTQYQITRYHSY